MGNIGEEEKRVELVPERELNPLTAPTEAPAVPVREPEKVPG